MPGIPSGNRSVAFLRSSKRFRGTRELSMILNGSAHHLIVLQHSAAWMIIAAVSLFCQLTWITHQEHSFNGTVDLGLLACHDVAP